MRLNQNVYSDRIKHEKYGYHLICFLWMMQRHGSNLFTRRLMRAATDKDHLWSRTHTQDETREHKWKHQQASERAEHEWKRLLVMRNFSLFRSFPPQISFSIRNSHHYIVSNGTFVVCYVALGLLKQLYVLMALQRLATVVACCVQQNLDLRGRYHFCQASTFTLMASAESLRLRTCDGKLVWEPQCTRCSATVILHD